MRSTRTFFATTLAGGLGGRLVSGCLCLCFRVAFTGFNGGGVACNVADQSILLCFANQSFVYELWQLHACELIEGSGESRFVRHLPGLFPAADAAQLCVAGQSIQQLSGERESVDGFGDEGAGDGEAVLRRPADPTSAGGDEAGQRNHLQGSYQALGWRGQFSEFVLEDGEELRLEQV